MTTAGGKLICTSCKREIPQEAERVILEDAKAGRSYFFHNTSCGDAAYRLAFSHRPGRRLRVVKARTSPEECGA